MFPTTPDGQPAHTDLLSVRGRIGRMRYVGWGMTYFLGLLALSFALGMLSGDDGRGPAVLSWALSIVSTVVTVVLARRRIEDLDGRTGWAFVMLVPLVNIGVLLWLTFTPGTPGPNRHGPAPAPVSRPFAIAAVCATAASVVLVLLLAYTVVKLQAVGEQGDSTAPNSVEARY